MMQLILPGQPEFYETLYSAPHPEAIATANRDGDNYAFVVRPDSGGIATPVTMAELEEFMEGGEYDQRLIELENGMAVLDDNSDC